MGWTTVVEFDHDHFRDISALREWWVDALMETMRAGQVPKEGVGVQGVRVISTFHRGEGMQDRAWEEYKRSIGR